MKLPEGKGLAPESDILKDVVSESFNLDLHTLKGKYEALNRELYDIVQDLLALNQYLKDHPADTALFSEKMRGNRGKFQKIKDRMQRLWNPNGVNPVLIIGVANRSDLMKQIGLFRVFQSRLALKLNPEIERYELTRAQAELLLKNGETLLNINDSLVASTH